MTTATKQKTGDQTVYVPIEGFVADIDGQPTNFRGDYHRVSAAWLDEHPKLRHLFRPIRLHYDVEQATANPGELR